MNKNKLNVGLKIVVIFNWKFFRKIILLHFKLRKRMVFHNEFTTKKKYVNSNYVFEISKKKM